MKKFFRNLMLVAVAAMAFVACSQEGNEVNVLSKGGTTYEFVAEFNDTRAHFEEKTDGIYPIVWDKDEEFVFASNVLDGSTNEQLNVTFSPSKVTFAEDTNKVFLTYELYDWIGGITPNSTIKVFNINDMTSAYNDGAFTGTYETQTPTATSVDPNFIALVAKYQVDDNGNPELSSKFEHITAYGQITVNGIEEELKEAVLTIDDYTYNLNVEGLENKVYYFACAPDEDVDNFTIRVITVDGNVYEREYELADGKLSFTAGRINEFSVKNLVLLDKYYFAASYRSYAKTFDLGIYENASDNTLATFEVNQPSDVAILPEGTYSIADNTLGYCYHIVYGDYAEYKQLSAATMTVEHLTEGYHIIVTYTYDGVEYTYECNGTVRAQDEYFLNPGDPMPIATPTVNASVENDYDIVLTWDAVDGAKDYTVSWNYGESSETVTDPRFTLTGEPFTSYEFSVVANASSEEDANSHAGKANVTIRISKDANGTVETVFDTMTDLGNNKYKFTVSNTSGTEYTDRDFMVLEFNKAISEGVYSLDDLNYWSGQSHFCVSDNRKPTGSKEYYDSQYSFPYYWIYNNACIYVEESNGSYNFTVFATNNYWFGDGNIFKGVYVEKSVLATPVLTSEINGNAITVNWERIEGAANYTVTLNDTEYTTTETSMLFEGLDYATNYYITVVANPADASANKPSVAAEVYVMTQEDPTPSISVDQTEVFFNYTNNNAKWVKVTVKNIESDITATSDNEQFSFEIVGSSVVISANDNLTSEVITGTITVSAGDFSTTISVTQEAKPTAIELTSAVAVRNEEVTFYGEHPYDVTFKSATTGEEVTLRFNTGGKKYIPVGEWQTENYQADNYISNVKLVGGNPSLNSCNVAYENDQYIVTMAMYDWNNSKNLEFIYTGAIDGLGAPGTDSGDEPGTGEDGGEDPAPEVPTNVTELTITNHFTIFRESIEHELGFYYDEANGKFVDIDFISNPIIADTYTLETGLSGMYCKSHGGSMSKCTVIVTDNGDGTLTFDATFKAGDDNWYHFNYTAKIYE